MISPHYDSMIAKVIAWGETREEATSRLLAALRETTLLGVITNQSFLIDILEQPFFEKGETFTTTIESETWTAPDVPEWVEEVGKSQLEKGPRRVATSGGDADAFSPWQSLGGFRMGE